MDHLHKIVSWMTSPLGIAFLGLLVGLLLRLLNRNRLAVWAWCLSAVLLWLFGCGVTTRLVGLPLELDEVDEATLPRADAIVLLGGGAGIHPKCGRAEMFMAADRAWMASRLWKRFDKEGKAPVLTVSGGGAAAELMLLNDFGVDTNGVVNLSTAKNTEEEARMIAEAIGKRDGKEGPLRILLVSSAWHLPRARVLFERAGFEVIPAPTDCEMHFSAEGELKFGDFLPNADSLLRNSYAVKEWVARFCYWIKR